MLLLYKRKRKEGCYYKAICKRRFVIKCQIRVNVTNCINLILNALKSNTKFNAKLNAYI